MELIQNQKKLSTSEDEMIRFPENKNFRFPENRKFRFPEDKMIHFPEDEMIRFPEDKMFRFPDDPAASLLVTLWTIGRVNIRGFIIPAYFKKNCVFCVITFMENI